jgi:hypothetical protein
VPVKIVGYFIKCISRIIQVYQEIIIYTGMFQYILCSKKIICCIKIYSAVPTKIAHYHPNGTSSIFPIRISQLNLSVCHMYAEFVKQSGLVLIVAPVDSCKRTIINKLFRNYICNSKSISHRINFTSIHCTTRY